MILDGIWDFAWSEKDTASPVYNDFSFVPDCFDNMQQKFNRRGYAFYRRKVTASENLRLEIGSFGLHAKVFWDGKELAESYLAWSPLEVEFVSSPGEHELLIKVDNVLEGHPLFREFYDFYGFGGIYDHVTLEEVKENEIKKLVVLPQDHTTGEIEVIVETSAPCLEISFDGKFFCKKENTPRFRLNVPDFKLWSPESPNLHTIKINEKEVTFGIRTLNWSGERLLLNGQPVKILGVNRHESHPEFGPATPESLIANDLRMLKAAGCNFIRGSHYPQRKFFFEMCDRLGIMVWEEPLAWGNKVVDLTDARFVDTLEEQLRLTIRNSINHPSLIIHGFLNECVSDTQEAYNVIKRYMAVCHEEDATRPASFATNRPARDICHELVDVVSMNVYPGWYGTEKLEEIPEKLDNFAKIVSGKPKFVSEIGAAAICGDHSGAPWSEDYQAAYIRQVVESIRNNPEWSGVMLWLFCNCNTYTGTDYMVMRPRGFNNKGLLDEYRRPKMAWKILPELFK